MRVRFYSGVPEIGYITVTRHGTVDLVSAGVKPGPVSVSVPSHGDDIRHSVFLAVKMFEAPYGDKCPYFWGGVRVPVGKVKVTRHSYRVRGDGRGGSDTTRGKLRVSVTEVLCGRDDSLADALRTAIANTAAGEDFGTLDSYPNDTVWRTVPYRDLTVSESSERRYGEAYVSHTISVAGFIACRMGEVARAFQAGGVSW